MGDRYDELIWMLPPFYHPYSPMVAQVMWQRVGSPDLVDYMLRVYATSCVRDFWRLQTLLQLTDAFKPWRATAERAEHITIFFDMIAHCTSWTGAQDELSMSALAATVKRVDDDLPFWTTERRRRERGVHVETVSAMDETRYRMVEASVKAFLPGGGDTGNRFADQYAVTVLHRYLIERWEEIPVYPCWVKDTMRMHSHVPIPSWFPTVGQTYYGPGYYPPSDPQPEAVCPPSAPTRSDTSEELEQDLRDLRERWMREQEDEYLDSLVEE